MADDLTPEQRSYCMSHIRSKDTKPELIVRRIVHSLGFRYRLHRKDLPGKPDIVFQSRKKIIFVHGCFWHSHNCRVGRVKPKSNIDYWVPKLESNRKKDKKTKSELKRLGWSVIVIWECQTKDKGRIKTIIKNFLR